ncbi:peptidoglycan recognition family protein [Lawsonibacter celer]|uniref:peptidoglycan recognition protein family protein n=1 Tax=Lawsonibacter celer TaxID=2986526 RepID=UPI00311AB680
MEQTAVRRPPTRRHRRRRRRRCRGIPFAALLLAILAAGLLAGRLLSGDARSKNPKVKQPPDNPEWITQALLPVNDYSRPGTPLDAINGIVIHYVGNPGTTAEQNHSYFAGLARSGETYASSHFLVGLDGEILQNVPLDEVAYCSSQRNSDTLSIECCHPDEAGEFTQETYDALVRLTAWLMDYYGLDTSQVIRHYDVTGKECPRYYVQHPEAWEAFLSDLDTGTE